MATPEPPPRCAEEELEQLEMLSRKEMLAQQRVEKRAQQLKLKEERLVVQRLTRADAREQAMQQQQQ